MGKVDEAELTDNDDKGKVVKKKATKPKKKRKKKIKSGKLYRGVIVCIAAIIVIILFVPLDLSTDKLVFLGLTNTQLWQAMFVVAPHSSSLIGNGMWSIIAALISGSFVAGLGIRNIKKGIIVGIISFGILILLQLAIGFLFDFIALADWYTLIIPSNGGNIFLDFVLSIGVLMGAGAIGGALTRE